MAANGIRSAFSYCVQQVRTYNYHNYLCLLELPPSMRKAAFALHAYNIETARAMDIASDPKIGLMRLLFWQEAIEKISSNKLIEHPVAQALKSVMSEHKISKMWLKKSVEARIKDAQREGLVQSIEDLEQYAEDTVSTILYTTLQAGGIASTSADHAASHIGKASGLLLLIRSLPYHVTHNNHRQCLYIPANLAEKHGLLVKMGGQVDIRVDSRQEMCDAVFEMASVANSHLVKARELCEKVPVEAKPVLLPGVPAQFMLDSLARVQFDVFDPRLTRGILGALPLWFQFKLKLYSWRGKY